MSSAPTAVKPGRSPRRYLVATAVAFGAGVAAGRLLELEPEHVMAAAAGAAALSIIAFFLKRPAALAAGTLACVALTGALDFSVRSGSRPADEVGALLRLEPGRQALATVTGRVEEATPTTNAANGRYYVRMVLAVESLGGADRAAPAGGRLRVSLDGDEDGLPENVKPGARIRVPLLLATPDPPRSPGAMDYPAYLATRGIWTVGTGRAALCEVLPGGGPTAGSRLIELREKLSNVVREHLPKREGALLNTLLIGWKNEMEPEEEMAFTRTGTGHLLAVSGINVMLLVGSLWWMLRMLRVPPRWAAAALIAFSIAYAEVAGARSPVVRAAIMSCIFLGGMVFERDSDGINSLAAAFLAIIVVWPRELFGIGFQLSFAAVAAIMVVTPALEEAWSRWRGLRPEDLATEKREMWRAKAGQYLRLSIFSSIAATLGTLPLIVGCFGILSPWSVLINLVAIPIANLVLALGLIFLAVGMIVPPLIALPGALVWGTLVALEWVVWAAEKLPACALVADAPPGWTLVVFYALAAALLLAGRRLGRWRAAAVAAMLAVSVLVSVSGWLLRERPADPRVTVLAARRGQAALYETPDGRTACPWAGAGRDLVDCLRHERLGSIDVVAVGVDREDLLAGGTYLRRSGRARSFALPAGDITRTQPMLDLLVAEPRCERIAPGWRRALGEHWLSAHGAEGRPASGLGSSFRPRPEMILAGGGNGGGEDGAGAALFADFSHPQSVRAAADDAAAGRLKAGLIVTGFAWQQRTESMRRSLEKDAARLIRESGARVAVLGYSRFDASEHSGRELARMLRRNGLLVLSTQDFGSLRCTLRAERIELEHYADGRWRPLGFVRRRAPAKN